MNYIDIVLILPLLWGIWKGFSKGLIIEITTLVALVLGVWGGIHFSDYMAEVLSSNFEFDEQYLPMISFALTFLLILALVFALGKLVERMIGLVALGLVNKIAGGAFGLAKFGLIISILLVLINSYDERLHFIPKEVKEGSLLYQPMTNFALTVVPALENSKMVQDIQNVATSDTTATVVPNLPVSPE